MCVCVCVCLFGPSSPSPIHTKCLDKWAGSICELDIMYQLEEVHFVVDEMVQNGYIVETNKINILRPIALMERESQKSENMFR